MSKELLDGHIKSIATSPSTSSYILIESITGTFTLNSVKRSSCEGRNLLRSRTKENTCDTIKTKLCSIVRVNEKYLST